MRARSMVHMIPGVSAQHDGAAGAARVSKLVAAADNADRARVALASDPDALRTRSEAELLELAAAATELLPTVRMPDRAYLDSFPGSGASERYLRAVATNRTDTVGWAATALGEMRRRGIGLGEQTLALEALVAACQ